jgi:hypothetical protein
VNYLTYIYRESQGTKSNGNHATKNSDENRIHGQQGEGSHTPDNNQRVKSFPVSDQYKSQRRWLGRKDGDILGLVSNVFSGMEGMLPAGVGLEVSGAGYNNNDTHLM